MPNEVRPEDERRLLRRGRCFEELALRIFPGGIVDSQDLAGRHLLAKVRPMSVRDATGRGNAGSRAANRRPFASLDRIEEHLCFSQVRARLDDSLTGVVGSLAGLFFSVHHAASPPTMPSTAGWTQMPMHALTMRLAPI